MYAFDFTAPGSVDEAVKMLSADEDAKVMAGGQTLIPTLKQRLAAPTQIVDLNGLTDLRTISEEGGALKIGAMATHASVAASDVVKARIPALAELAEGIGDPQVRNRGTIGGSIANNDPAADYPAALVALGATVETSKRKLSAEEFFTGMFETALDDDELVLAVHFPIPGKACYMKFPNPASRYAIVGVMVAKTGSGVRVAVTGAASCVFRATAMEDALSGTFSPAALDGIEVERDDYNADLHATAEYRRHLVTVMAKRAVGACL